MTEGLRRLAALIVGLAVLLAAMQLDESLRQPVSSYSFKGLTVLAGVLTVGSVIGLYMLLSLLFRHAILTTTCFALGGVLPVTLLARSSTGLAFTASMVSLLSYIAIIDPKFTCSRRTWNTFFAMTRGQQQGNREYSGFRAVLDDNADRRWHRSGHPPKTGEG